jgi:hypothetical protein
MVKGLYELLGNPITQLIEPPGPFVEKKEKQTYFIICQATIITGNSGFASNIEE